MQQAQNDCKAPNGGPITSQSQLRIGLMTGCGEFGIDKEQHSILRLEVLLNPDDEMELERMRIEVAGERYESLDWKTMAVSGTNGCSIYFPVDGVTPGKHDVRIEGYAEGRWWRSAKAYSIEFRS